MLVLAISVYLDELLENGRLTAVTPLCEAGGIMVMTVHLTIVFVVAIGSAKNGWTDRTGEMVDVVFAIEGGDVGSTQGLSALVAKEAKAPKIIGFAERVLAVAVLVVNGEELGSDNLSTILQLKGAKRDVLASQKLLGIKQTERGGGLQDQRSLEGESRQRLDLREPTYTAFEAIEMVCAIEGADKLASQLKTTLLA